MVATFPECIEICSFFNSLRASQKAHDLFKKNISQKSGSENSEGSLKKSLTVREFRHAKDIPSLLGNKERFPTTEGHYYIYGSTADKITHLNAHSFLCLSSKEQPTVDSAPDATYLKITHFAERVRKMTGSIISPIHKRVLGTKNIPK